MRLTLRTLLAYLDDALPPDKAREIGVKVSESPVAQELIERIKKVTRRRSLANPPVHGEASKLDPNTVADYIDGQLSPEEVEQVDVTCLSEDVYLAEVAACHQILTLMLSEPARVPPTARQRMYALVKGPEAIPYRPPPAYQPSVDGSAAVVDEDEPRRARWPWYIAGVMAAALGLAFAIWLAWPKDKQPPHRAKSNGGLALATPSTPAVPPTKPAGNDKKEPPRNNDSKNVTEEKKKKNDDVKPEPKKNNQVEPVKNGKAAPKKSIDQPPPTAPSAARRNLGQFVSADSVLLHQGGEEQIGWQRLLKGDRVASQVALLSLPAFRSEIQLESGVQVILSGSVPEFQGPPTFESSVTLHEPAGGFEADLTIHRGRVFLQNKREQQAIQVRLRFRKEVWDVTIEQASEIVLDLEIAYAPGVRFSKDPGGDEPTARVYLGVPKGKARLKIGYQKPIGLQAPPGPALIGWDSKGGSVRETIRLKEVLPIWSTTLPDHAAAREMAKSRDKLVQDLAKRDASVAVMLTELGQEPVPTDQVLSVFCLGAIEALPELLDTMDDPEKPIVRGAAIFALRHWCARAPENDLRLHKLLMEKKNYTEAQADLVLQLLHYFSEFDLQQPATFTALFEYLRNERLSVRELAFAHLAQVDPDGARQALYSPGASDAERDAAIARWRKRIPEGKLPPKPATPRDR